MKRYVTPLFFVFFYINKATFFFLVDTHADKTGTPVFISPVPGIHVMNARNKLVLIKETILHK